MQLANRNHPKPTGAATLKQSWLANGNVDRHLESFSSASSCSFTETSMVATIHCGSFLPAVRGKARSSVADHTCRSFSVQQVIRSSRHSTTAHDPMARVLTLSRQVSQGSFDINCECTWPGVCARGRGGGGGGRGPNMVSWFASGIL